MLGSNVLANVIDNLLLCLIRIDLLIRIHMHWVFSMVSLPNNRVELASSSGSLFGLMLVRMLSLLIPTTFLMTNHWTSHLRSRMLRLVYTDNSFWSSRFLRLHSRSRPFWFMRIVLGSRRMNVRVAKHLFSLKFGFFLGLRLCWHPPRYWEHISSLRK